MAVRKSTKRPAKKSVKANKAPAKRVAAKNPAKRAAPARVAAKKALAPAKQTKADPAPANAPLPLRDLTPMLVINGASKAITWYTKALGAKEISRNLTPDGKIMHAAIWVGDSILMLADSFMGPVPEKMTGVTLHIQRADINELWAKAVANGATVEMPLADQFWGDRYGQLRDPFGHSWSFGWPAKVSAARKEQLRVEAMAMFASMK